MIKNLENIDKHPSAFTNEVRNNNKPYILEDEYSIEPDESDIYEPDNEEEYAMIYEEDIAWELECKLEGIGALQEHLHDSLEAENILKELKDIIIRKIGEEKYKRIIDVCKSNIISLNYRLSDKWESYDSLNACFNKFCHKN